TEAVAPQRSIATQDVVTGNQPGDRVGAHRVADCAGTGRPDGLREGTIGGRRGCAKLEQRPPDFELEVPAGHRDRQHRWGGVCAARAAADALRQLLSSQVVANSAGVRPLGVEALERRSAVARVDEGEVAQTARGVCEQRGAEGAVTEAIADLQLAAPRLQL